MTIPLQTQIAYGPVASRRLGRSLGVNVLPDGRKVCNFNCAYCQYGWTPPLLLDRAGSPESLRNGAALPWPSVPMVLDAVDQALVADCAVDHITLAGNGEPTLHPDFAGIVDGVRTIRDRRAPQARLAILSNASTLGRPAIFSALARVDERYMKLDAGDDAMLRRLNGAAVPLSMIVEGLGALGVVTLQSLFTRDAERRIDNTSAVAVGRWLAAVREIRPAAVHIYSIDRDPAWKRLERVPREELGAIAARVRGEGIEAMVF